jgi:probable rRNA maturation factor
MTTTVIVEAEAWNGLSDVEGLVIRAVNAAFVGKPCNVDVMLTDDQEIRGLNLQFRKNDKATNVLSFPAALMPVPEGEMAHLGDIVLAYETVAREASEAGKSIEHHTSHLVIHAMLHLLGYDHETDEEAEAMEQQERDILARLGIADPYLT